MIVLAGASALLGRWCRAGLARVQRTRRLREEATARKYQALSLQALPAGNKAAYLAANRLAWEAHGLAMALAAGRAAALIWPACAALAWANWRFDGVPLPLVGQSAGPTAFFIPLYGLAHWGLGEKKRCLRRPGG